MVSQGHKCRVRDVSGAEAQGVQPGKRLGGACSGRVGTSCGTLYPSVTLFIRSMLLAVPGWFRCRCCCVKLGAVSLRSD